MTDSKWADFVITAVGYNEKRTHIVEAEVREDLGSSLGSPKIYKQQEVITLI